MRFPSGSPDLLQGPKSETRPVAMRKIQRPGLGSRHNDAHDGDCHLGPGDINRNDLVKTRLPHPLDDEFDVIVYGWMLIGRDMVEVDGLHTAVPRLRRRRSRGRNEIRQVLSAALD